MVEGLIINKIKFPHYLQHDQIDCGPTCLRMVSKFYGKKYSHKYLTNICKLGSNGTSFQNLSDAAESLGFKTFALKTQFENLKNDIKLPCIAHWDQHHYIVIYKINGNTVHIADPSFGLKKFPKKEFLKNWEISSSNQGSLLLLEPTAKFYSKEGEFESKSFGIKFLFHFLSPYKSFLLQLFAGLLLGSIIQLIFPFLTQLLVDYGVNNKDLSFIYTILLGQIMLFIGQTSVNFIRSWILLYLGTKLNISILSEFLTKLMKLPVSFFDTKKIGDILQRVLDNKRIEFFITNSLISTLLSFLNLLVFSLVLAFYNMFIFELFLFGSLISTFWMLIFLKKRREIDYNLFSTYSENYNKIFQLIYGIRDIKLNNNEKQKKWEWQKVQAKLFKIQIKSLSYNQYQQTGSQFFTQLKNIIITFFAAKAVIEGEISLGMMMAASYIIGQLSLPIEQIITFIQASQDAKLSAERLLEIYNQKEEDSEGVKISDFNSDEDISMNNVSFSYSGSESEYVLNDLNLVIERGKITAIVGPSGSGKTTLVKLLLKFYLPQKGEIYLGKKYLANVDCTEWRKKCGVVMQDGFIFTDTVANNIGLSSDNIDRINLHNAIKIANLDEFVETLPLKLGTKIGPDEHGLSQGQKQRILIARSVYKNPKFIFFDEATNALDAENEMLIINNLKHFFIGKTVVIVAHRLSSVKDADKIIVLEKGKIIEVGNHIELTNKKGFYYNLIKNQLELGN